MSVTVMSFPIRLRILATLLLVTTVALSLITAVMGNLFHKDKTAYIKDLTTVIATRAADESAAAVDSYYKTLRVFAELVADRQLTSEETSAVIDRLFYNYGEFMLIYLKQEGYGPVVVYNTKAMSSSGLNKNELLNRLKRFIKSANINDEKAILKNIPANGKMPLVNVVSNFEVGEYKTKVTAGAITYARSLWNIVDRSTVAEIAITDLSGKSIVNRSGHSGRKAESVSWVMQDGDSVNQPFFSSITKEYKTGGSEFIGSVARVVNSNLLIGVSIPKSAVFLTARVLLKDLIFLSLILIAAAALVSVFLARKLTRSLEKLSKATFEVGRGRFDILVDVRSKDEIGLLSNSFNQMVHELKSREDKLNEAQAALVQSEKLSAIGRLTAGIAHEVKNPLTGILGHAQLALRKLDEDHVARKNIDIIEQETVRCVEIIQDLMKFSRAENDTALKVINVNEVAANTAKIVEPTVSDHKSSLKLALNEGVPVVKGNANQLKQVLMNLVINAIQAMEASPGKITISTYCKNNKVHIAVADDGPGMPEDVQKKIFDPFFTTKPAGQGTGLGLSVAYGIIDTHKGKIDLQSTPGEGTTFTIILPIAGHGENES